MKLSIVIITQDEEAAIGATLASVSWAEERIVLDSGSTDRTVQIARSLGAKVFSEEWKGYGAQKNSAIEKASGDWVLSLDADEAVEPALAEEIKAILRDGSKLNAYWIPRKNFFLGRWMRHGGFYPDRKLRLFRRGTGHFQERFVHETLQVEGTTGTLKNALIHSAYPTLEKYLHTMNRYSSLGAEIAVTEGHGGFSIINIMLRPNLTFLYNYIFRLGFLDGREGLLLHLYHAYYVSWKYAKAWEKRRTAKR